MLDKLAGLIFLAWLSSCTTVQINQSTKYINPELKKYAAIFVAEAYLRDVEVSLEKVNLDFAFELTHPLAVGVCQPGRAVNSIRILKFEWDEMSKSEKEALILHELGHCVLFREHCDAVTRSGTPYSLMHSTHFFRGAYPKYRKYYLDELFKPSKRCEKYLTL